MSTKKERFWRSRLITGAALVGALGVAAIGIATPALAAGSHPTLAASNIRSDSNASSTIVKTVAKGMTLTIDCYSNGQKIRYCNLGPRPGLQRVYLRQSPAHGLEQRSRTALRHHSPGTVAHEDHS